MLSINSVKSVASRGLLVGRKYSPEICLGLGIAGFFTATFLACRATLKVDGVNQKTEEDLKKVNDGKENLSPEEYSEEDYRRDLAVVYVQKWVALGKLYGPSILIGLASVSLIVGSHHILTKRNAGLVAAYKILDSSFGKYRQNVIDKLGSDKDHEFRYGGKTEEITQSTYNDADGEVKEQTKVTTVHPHIDSENEYARMYNEDTSTQYQRDYLHNLYYLQSQEHYANDLLNIRGHVFLNEVYDALGMERSKAGAVVGWVHDKGDGYVDFNLNAVENDPKNHLVDENGKESFLLDFNVCGVIYDLI